MEGLIPLVYKAIKGNKTRRKYRCLSQGQALHHNRGFDCSPKKASYGEEFAGHRRHKSVDEYSGEMFCSLEMTTAGGAVASLSKSNGGSRSLRMFSCINAA